jgi:hypothetical protein
MKNKIFLMYVFTEVYHKLLYEISQLLVQDFAMEDQLLTLRD